MRMRWMTGLLWAAIMMAVSANRANAAIITFSATDAGAGSANPRPNSDAAAAAYDAAAGLLGTATLVNFESAPLGSFSNLTIAPGVTINGTDFLSNPQTIRNTPFSSPDSVFGYNTTAGGSQFVYVNGGTLTFSFTQPVNSFGAYITGVQVDGETITFSDGTQQSVPIPNPDPNGNGGAEFVGFTDAGASIVSITLVADAGNASDFIGVDDVRFTTPAATAVPEPATMIMFGTGVLTLAGYRRRARKQAA
jgi:hypothetical protein